MSKMLGKTGQPHCGTNCTCGEVGPKHRRKMRRRERQAVARQIREEA